MLRTGDIEEEAIAHEGSKGARAIYLKNGLVFTTGMRLKLKRQSNEIFDLQFFFFIILTYLGQ